MRRAPVSPLAGLGSHLAGRRGFSPLSLDPVAFYDPSDTSTLFQDVAGTTPAGVGDPVRLMLDKSQGLVLGENLADPVSAVTPSPEDWQIDEEAGTYQRVGGSGFSELQFFVDPNLVYLVEFTINTTASAARLIRRNVSDTGNDTLLSDLTDGTFTARVLIFDTVFDRIVFTGDGWRGTISDVSIREISGYHLTAPSDSARPVLQSSGGLYWLEFDGVDDRLEVSSRLGLPTDPDLTVCVAIEKSGEDFSDLRVFHLGSSGPGSIAGSVGIGEVNGNSWRFNNGNIIFPATASGAPEVMTWARSSNDTYEESLLYADSTAQIAVSSTSPSGLPTDTGAAFTLGVQPNTFNPFLGKMHGVLVFSENLSTTNREKVESYLASKQGRTL